MNRIPNNNPNILYYPPAAGETRKKLAPFFGKKVEIKFYLCEHDEEGESPVSGYLTDVSVKSKINPLGPGSYNELSFYFGSGVPLIFIDGDESFLEMNENACGLIRSVRLVTKAQ